MPIRLSGMVSGLDTEAIVEELMTAQRAKQTKVENKQTKLTWKQEKWKELNTKLYSLYTTELNKLTLQSSYLTKKASVSDELAGQKNGVNTKKYLLFSICHDMITEL